MESALAGVLAALALFAVLQLGVDGDGLIFVAALAAYVAGRQILFPLRAIPRATAYGRRITLTVAALVAAGAVSGVLVR